MPTRKNHARGFTMVELLISMALGLIVLGVAVQLYVSALNATWTVSQRASMQEDVRASANIMVKDLSMAGAGFPAPGGVIGLASGTGTFPAYGCDIVGACHLGVGNNAAVNFPGKQLFAVIPGFGTGIVIPPNVTPSDTITVAYTDSAPLYLNCYNVTSIANANTVVFTMPVVPNAGCTSPPLPAYPPAPLNSPAPLGLSAGDLVWFRNAGTTAIGEVTAAPVGANPYTVTFANADTMQLNQNAATSADLNQMLYTPGPPAVGLPPGPAYRIWLVTYYLDRDPVTATPRLMRQVSGHQPMPVAENVVGLNFSYDTYDQNGVLHTRVKTLAAWGALGANPNTMVQKINIENLTIRSPLQGTKGFQSLNLNTSVSLRNLSWANNPWQ